MNINKDKILSINISIIFILTAISGIIAASSQIFPNIIFLTRIPIIITWILSLLSNIYLILKKGIKQIYLTIFLTTIFSFFVSGLMIPENFEYLQSSLSIFLVNFSIAYLLIHIKDFTYFEKIMLSNSYILFALFASYLLYLIASNQILSFGIEESGLRYSMTFAYKFLPIINFLQYCFFYRKQNKIIISILILLGILFEIIWGCRGAILCIISYTIILFLRNCYFNHNFSKFIIGMICLSFISIITVLNISELNQTVKEFGFASRNLTKLIQSHDASSMTSGRTSIYIRTIEEIENKPFIIKGINADYSLHECYSHNIILEIYYDFGGIIGTIIIILLITISLKTLFTPNQTKLNNIKLYFFCNCSMRLLVSSSLFIEPYFCYWMLLSIRQINLKYSDFSIHKILHVLDSNKMLRTKKKLCHH